MFYRNLGHSGLKVSAVSYGSWITFGNQLHENDAAECMKIAYENGINFFDNAEVYASGQSERIMGTVLKKFGWQRDSYVISSKVFWGGDKPNQKGLSRKHVFEACNAALQRLQLDYLDLFFCHRPDESTPIEETVWAMHALYLQGKILYWGTSEWSASQIMEAHSIARQHHLLPPSMEQPQYNMLHREKVEKELRQLYTNIGLGLTIWSPLASGLLTGKYNDGKAPEGSRATLAGYEFLKDRLIGHNAQTNITKVKAVGILAQQLGITPAQLAIAWCLKNPMVSTVILGARNPQQLQENMTSIDAVQTLTESIMNSIEDILQNKPEFMLFQ